MLALAQPACKAARHSKGPHPPAPAPHACLRPQVTLLEEPFMRTEYSSSMSYPGLLTKVGGARSRWPAAGAGGRGSGTEGAGARFARGKGRKGTAWHPQASGTCSRPTCAFTDLVLHPLCEQDMLDAFPTSQPRSDMPAFLSIRTPLRHA